MPVKTATTIPLICAAACAVVVPANAADEPLAKCTIKPKKSYSMTAVLNGGVKVKTTCDGPAGVLIGMKVRRPVKLWLRMPGNGIQDVGGTGRFAAAGTKEVRVTMSRRSRARLSKGDKRFSGPMRIAVGRPGENLYRGEPGSAPTVTFKR